MELSPLAENGSDDLEDDELVSSDQIAVGNIANSVAAIGRGASVVYHQALTAADQARAQESLEQEKLARAVARLVDNLRTRAATPAPASGSPYKYLLPYDIADAAHFFGRERLVQSLFDDLTCDDSRCHLAVVHGEAGVGKTSLLRAGLAPLLIANQHLPLVVRVTQAPLVESIKQSLLGDLNATPNLAQVPLPEFLRQVGDLLPPGKRVCVLIDQFEAFFDLPLEARQQFVEELAACLYNNDPRDNWVIAIREFRLGQLTDFQPTVPQPLANASRLPYLDRDEACTAILEPARLANLELEDGLLEAMLDDLGPKEYDPSSLQMVCHTLVEGLRRGEKRLTLAAYQEAGRAEGILRSYLDITLERHFPQADQELAWHTLVALLERPNSQATQAELVADLRPYGAAPDETQRMLDLLESNRLVRLSGASYHLANRSFRRRIRQWAAQRAALEQARLEARRQVERIRNSALRGFLGGALGFMLAILVAFYSQISTKDLLILLTVQQAPPGAVAGLLLLLIADISLISYLGKRRWLRWPVVGLAGAISFSLALVSLAFLLGSASQVPAHFVILEGVLWGLAAGLGTVWVMSSRRPAWLTIPPAALACGLVLWLADSIGRAFVWIGTPPAAWLLVLAGAMMPLFVMITAVMGRPATPQET